MTLFKIKFGSKIDLMVERLFVYGTLAPGCPNEHILKNIDGTWQEATVIGKLKEKGWGAKMGYFGIELDNNKDAIKGFIFQSKNLSNYWDMLDNFEGKEYKRVITKAKLANGSIVEAYIYALRD